MWLISRVLDAPADVADGGFKQHFAELELLQARTVSPRVRLIEEKTVSSIHRRN